jgi:hypothetical protein
MAKLDPESKAANDRVKAGQAAGAQWVDAVNGQPSEDALADGVYGPVVQGEIEDTSGQMEDTPRRRGRSRNNDDAEG